MGVEPVACLDRCVSNTTEWSRPLRQCLLTSTKERKERNSHTVTPPPSRFETDLGIPWSTISKRKRRAAEDCPHLHLRWDHSHCGSRSSSSDSVLSEPLQPPTRKIHPSGNPSYRRARDSRSFAPYGYAHVYRKRYTGRHLGHCSTGGSRSASRP